MFSKHNLLLEVRKKTKRQNALRDFFIHIKHITKVFLAQVYNYYDCTYVHCTLAEIICRMVLETRNN